MRARAAGRWLLVSVLMGTGTLGWVQAQDATANRPRESSVATSLPIRRVILYKSGVGYFEHLGRVHGTQDVTIDFTSGQLDDVLSTLTTLDLDGGRVLGVSYNSDDALDRRLGALHLPVGATTTPAALLGALRGARVEIGRSGDRIAQDQQRVRDNMQALKGTPEERHLVQRYVKQLDDQETQLAGLRQNVADLTKRHEAAEATLVTLIDALNSGGGASGAERPAPSDAAA